MVLGSTCIFAFNVLQARSYSRRCSKCRARNRHDRHDHHDQRQHNQSNRMRASSLTILTLLGTPRQLQTIFSALYAGHNAALKTYHEVQNSHFVCLWNYEFHSASHLRKRKIQLCCHLLEVPTYVLEKTLAYFGAMAMAAMVVESL